MTTIEGTRCASCGHVSWPPALYCAEGCGRSMQPVSISPRGTVYASTLLHVPHARFGSPYQVGYVDLEDGPRVFGHFREKESVPLGLTVDVRLEDPSDGSGSTDHPVVFFEPATAANDSDRENA